MVKHIDSKNALGYGLLTLLALFAAAGCWIGCEQSSHAIADFSLSFSSEWALNYAPSRALVCAKIYHKIQPTKPKNRVASDTLIAFSAVPGTGVSCSARAVAQSCQGYCLSSNELRNLLRELGVNPQQRDSHQLPWIQHVTRYCLDRLVEEGQSVIVLDKSIDRSYPLAMRWSIDRGWQLRVIRLHYDSFEQCCSLMALHPEAKNYSKFAKSWWNDYQHYAGCVDLEMNPLGPHDPLPQSVSQQLADWIQHPGAHSAAQPKGHPADCCGNHSDRTTNPSPPSSQTTTTSPIQQP